jgi:hypothetical protein
MAYCQLLAMQHIGLLGRLADLGRTPLRLTARTPAPFSLEDQDVLKFDWEQSLSGDGAPSKQAIGASVLRWAIIGFLPGTKTHSFA